MKNALSLLILVVLSTACTPPRSGAPAPDMSGIRPLKESVRTLVVGPQADAVSTITVNKILRAENLDSIRAVLAAVDPGLYRIRGAEIAQQGVVGRRWTEGSLPLTEVTRIRTERLRDPSLERAGFFISEITVTKVLRTREFESIRQILQDVDAQSVDLRAVELRNLTP